MAAPSSLGTCPSTAVCLELGMRPDPLENVLQSHPETLLALDPTQPLAWRPISPDRRANPLLASWMVRWMSVPSGATPWTEDSA